MSSLTFAVVSDDCFPLDVNLMSVDRKFLHFFTFSSVSCKHDVQKDIKGSPEEEEEEGGGKKEPPPE